MKHKIFTIYDEKAQAYFPPFFMPKKGMAKREFMNLVIDKNSSIAQHPQDYTLFYIGIFDDESADIFYKGQKECLGNGVEFRNNEVAGIEKPTPMEKILTPYPSTPEASDQKSYDLAAAADRLTKGNKTETPQI